MVLYKSRIIIIIITDDRP